MNYKKMKMAVLIYSLMTKDTITGQFALNVATVDAGTAIQNHLNVKNDTSEVSH